MSFLLQSEKFTSLHSKYNLYSQFKKSPKYKPKKFCYRAANLAIQRLLFRFDKANKRLLWPTLAQLFGRFATTPLPPRVLDGQHRVLQESSVPWRCRCESEHRQLDHKKGLWALAIQRWRCWWCGGADMFWGLRFFVSNAK